MEELLGHIERADTFDPRDAEEKRRKRAFFTSAGICCYFVAVAMAIILGYISSGVIGFAILVAFCGIGTMLIVFGRMSAPTVYEKAEDTLVEELKVRMTRGKRENKAAGMASSALWAFVLVIYFLVSFRTMAWQVTWIIFPIGAGAQCLLTAYLFPASRGKSFTGAYWCFITAVYFIVSFVTFDWHITWLIFIFAVAAHQAARLFVFWRSAE